MFGSAPTLLDPLIGLLLLSWGWDAIKLPNDGAFPADFDLAEGAGAPTLFDPLMGLPFLVGGWDAIKLPNDGAFPADLVPIGALDGGPPSILILDCLIELLFGSSMGTLLDCLIELFGGPFAYCLGGGSPPSTLLDPLIWLPFLAGGCDDKKPSKDFNGGPFVVCVLLFP